MKKNLFKFGLAMIFTLLGGCFISCSNGSGSSSDECKITVSVVNAPSSIETCTFVNASEIFPEFAGFRFPLLDKKIY